MDQSFDPTDYQQPQIAQQCHDRREYLLKLRASLNNQVLELRGRGRKRDPKPDAKTWGTINHLRDQALAAHAEIGALSWVLSLLQTPTAREAASEAVFSRLDRSRTRHPSP